MKKVIKITKIDGKINVQMNEADICSFEISKNKINGKDLFEALKIDKDDQFSLEPHGIALDSKEIDDVVVINTHSFFQKLIDRINQTLNADQKTE